MKHRTLTFPITLQPGDIVAVSALPLTRANERIVRHVSDDDQRNGWGPTVWLDRPVGDQSGYDSWYAVDLVLIRKGETS